MRKCLTHWGRVTHICVSKLSSIASDNGLSPVRRQAIIWTNAGILLIGPWVTNFSELLIDIHTFSFKKIDLKMSSAKWRPFCLGLNVLNHISHQHHQRRCLLHRTCWYYDCYVSTAKKSVMKHLFLLFLITCLLMFCCFCDMYFERETLKWMVVWMCLWRHTVADSLITIITVNSIPKAQFLMFYLHIFNSSFQISKVY